ncbi:mannitol dehydrogenase family protein [Alteromonadaceae bacterium BrNp21-10]|nr:mannitol dehydrogenase family protein [Alteromonadaceae bacterium BrNp21-10]
MKLTDATLHALPDVVATPDYDRQQNQIGIVHLGPGAFFRAHQAWYTDRALEKGGDWGICAVALNSNRVKTQLAPQQGLYTLGEIDRVTHFRVIGAVKEVLALKEDFDLVIQRLTAIGTKIVTMTITEKGYSLNAKGRLNRQDKVIQSDLQNYQQPSSAIGLLFLACQLRYQKGISPLSLISCDNLSDNGHKLKQALVDYAFEIDPTLAEYIELHVICPSTMVDSITPATDDKFVQQIAELGYEDNWPIKRESFSQWVIEDILPADIPAWAEVGVTFTDDVSGYENAKLRVLNATHSTLAYLGAYLGIETVLDAIEQPNINGFINTMLKEEITPSFAAPVDMDIQQYCDSIVARYHNPAIRHLLAQIAWDGSQKLPMRLLPVIEANLALGNGIQKCCLALAAWMRFIVNKQQQGTELVDPLAESLLAIAEQCQNDESDVARFLALDMFNADWANHADFINAVTSSYKLLVSHEQQNTRQQILA